MTKMQVFPSGAVDCHGFQEVSVRVGKEAMLRPSRIYLAEDLLWNWNDLPWIGSGLG